MNDLKNRLKQCAAVLAVASLLVSVAPVAEARTFHPKDPNHVPLPVNMIGCTPGRAELTSSAVQVVTGSGFLYWLYASGTAPVAGAGSQAFDTSNVATITGFTVTARSITPYVFATGNVSASVNGGVIGKFDSSAAPVRFESGLVILNSANTHNANACYRLDTGLNP